MSAPGQVIQVVETQVEVLQRRIDKLEAALREISTSRTRHSVFDPVPALNEMLKIAREALEKP